MIYPQKAKIHNLKFCHRWYVFGYITAYYFHCVVLFCGCIDLGQRVRSKLLPEEQQMFTSSGSCCLCPLCCCFFCVLICPTWIIIYSLLAATPSKMTDVQSSVPDLRLFLTHTHMHAHTLQIHTENSNTHNNTHNH